MSLTTLKVILETEKMVVSGLYIQSGLYIYSPGLYRNISLKIARGVMPDF